MLPIQHKLLQRLRQRDARIGVLGLGYVGLPLSMAFHEAGYAIVGLDVDATKVESLRAGRSYIRHIPASEVALLANSPRFSATTSYAVASECDALVICVPTPLTRMREPDLTFIESTCTALVPHLRSGQLVVSRARPFRERRSRWCRPFSAAAA
ncbi:MAG: hypothetical protein RL199_209 [Pseudomonadota bacterium]|jgi:UDP-N-acetyl-D-glucosamine dehydrogenase